MIILILVGTDLDGEIHAYKFEKLADIDLNKLTEPDEYGLSWRDFGWWAVFDTDKPQEVLALAGSIAGKLLDEPVWQYGGTKLEQLVKGPRN